MTDSTSTTEQAAIPAWVERASELGKAFDIKGHKLVTVTKKLPALRLENDDEDLPKEVGLGLIAAALAYQDPEKGYWLPDKRAFAEFEPFEELDHDTMLSFTRADRGLDHPRAKRQRVCATFYPSLSSPRAARAASGARLHQRQEPQVWQPRQRDDRDGVCHV